MRRYDQKRDTYAQPPYILGHWSTAIFLQIPNGVAGTSDRRHCLRVDEKTPNPSSCHTRRGAATIVRRLRRLGHNAFFVGGAVRDTLLNRPIREYDIATSATPDQVIAAFRRTVPVGVQFGVVLVILDDGEYEVATFRAETSYSDGRHPDTVRFVSAREDVLRRDFTINGLLQDPDSGDIEDYVDGRADLQARLIRAIGEADARFSEDHLRILRAIRFAACLAFDIETHTFRAIIRLAHTVADVAAERIQAELRRTFTEGDAVRAFTLLSVSGVIQVIFPALQGYRTAGTAQALVLAGNLCFAEALSLLLMEHPESRAIALSASWSERLKLPKTDREHLRYLVANRTRPESINSQAARLRFIREAHFDSFAKIDMARRTALKTSVAPLQKLVDLRATVNTQALHPTPLLTGRELKALGYRPGPHFKTMLLALEDAQLERRVGSVEEAVELMKSIMPLE